MELKTAAFRNKISRIKTFMRLVGLAIRTQFLLVPAMARNYLMFQFSNIILKISPLHRRGLAFGRNVRIQRLRSLVRIGRRSQIEIGDHTIVYENARLEAVGLGRIQIGECGVIGDCRISARESVKIGHRVLTSWNVFIQDNDPHPLDPKLRGEQVKDICRRFYPHFDNPPPPENAPLVLNWTATTAPIVIGDDVWLGANCIILKGARLGEGCIVASGSIVTAGEYPPRSILAGNPARVVKHITERELLA